MVLGAARRPLLAAVATTAGVTALSWLVPARWSATSVGLAFFAATWWLVLRRDDEEGIRRAGISLGGLLEPVRVDLGRLARAAAVATAWAALVALVTWPPFVAAWRWWWHARPPFAFRLSGAPADVLEEVAGQILVIALPEEIFYRGYLQTALDDAWGRRWRIAGASLGWGWVASCALFAVGHLLTEPYPARLAVFFPALLFGWLRARTGGVGAGAAYHAACNLLTATLARGYGMQP